MLFILTVWENRPADALKVSQKDLLRVTSLGRPQDVSFEPLIQIYFHCVPKTLKSQLFYSLKFLEKRSMVKRSVLVHQMCVSDTKKQKKKVVDFLVCYQTYQLQIYQKICHRLRSYLDRRRKNQSRAEFSMSPHPLINY